MPQLKWAVGEALPTMITEEEKAMSLLYPQITRIRDVSVSNPPVKSILLCQIFRDKGSADLKQRTEICLRFASPDM